MTAPIVSLHVDKQKKKFAPSIGQKKKKVNLTEDLLNTAAAVLEPEISTPQTETSSVEDIQAPSIESLESPSSIAIPTPLASCSSTPKSKTLKQLKVGADDHEKLAQDRKSVTVASLINKVPKGNSSASSSAATTPVSTPKTSPNKTRVPIAAPQLRIVNGKAILDQESIMISQTQLSSEQLSTEIINETNEMINYGSFVKRVHSDRWTPKEEEMFYKALKCCGTDFSMIQSLMPHRTRSQLKSKFKKEERSHPLKIRECLLKPDSLNQLAMEEMKNTCIETFSIEAKKRIKIEEMDTKKRRRNKKEN